VSEELRAGLLRVLWTRPPGRLAEEPAFAFDLHQVGGTEQTQTGSGSQLAGTSLRPLLASRSWELSIREGRVKMRIVGWVLTVLRVDHAHAAQSFVDGPMGQQARPATGPEVGIVGRFHTSANASVMRRMVQCTEPCAPGSVASGVHGT